MFHRILPFSSTFRTACAVGSAGALASTFSYSAFAFASPETPPEKGTASPPKLQRRQGAAPKPGEPVYTKEQVSEADGVGGRPMWITYRDGVYDVTEFHRIHPGGDLILQGVGGDVSAFWDIWAYHHHAPLVGKYLEKLRIGALKEYTAVEESTEEEEEENDPYESEPVRDINVQTVFTERPYCSETPNAVLGVSYLTSAEALYVRNHAPVPDCAWAPLDESRLSHAQHHEVIFETVCVDADTRGAQDAAAGVDAAAADADTDSAFTVAQLQAQYGTTTITSILQCAGNRASEDIAATGDSGFTGSPFETITQGMLGNAQWSGVRLADVLPSLYPAQCAAALKHGEGKWHVVFEGADGYSASTPLARVLRRENDCLLCTQMNGQPLTADHGYPMRALLPGVAGARNVKWLQSVSIQRTPVDAPWNSYYYKNAKAEQIQALPLQSLILEQKQKATNGNEETAIEVSGVAYSGGTGNAIAKVEVSTDGGQSWIDATLKVDEVKEDGSHRNFGWIRWEASLPEVKTSSVCCRAIDTEGNTQPAISPKERGYLYNGWQTVQVPMHN